MDEFNKFIDNEKDFQKYLFVRGFLLTNDNDLNLAEFPFYGNWVKQPLTDNFVAYTHFQQKVSFVEKNGVVFFLFGHAYNPFTMEYDEKIQLEKIASAYNTKTFQDSIDELTGIFVLGYIENSKVNFLVDPAGIQSACCGIVNGCFYLTSHAQLVGDLCNLQMSQIVKELVNYKFYYRILGPYLPADLTPFDELKRVVVNNKYTFDKNIIKHNRFYPLKDNSICKNDAEYEVIIEKSSQILKNNMELVLKKWNKPAISLTGGIDSNTTFSAANGFYDKIQTFSYVSAEKEIIDAQAAKKIADKFNVKHTEYDVPDSNEKINNFDKYVKIIDHNNGYVAKGNDNEYRKRAFLFENVDFDVEIKSWVSETVRAYWYKYYARKSMPKLSPKLYRNLYKIFIFNRSLAHKIDSIFEQYLNDFDYYDIPDFYLPADVHYNELGWGSWGSLNISEMKIYSDITIIYNNRKWLDLMLKCPLEYRISDKHHLDIKKKLNKELYDMNIRVKNAKETKFRAFMLNIIFTINSLLPF